MLFLNTFRCKVTGQGSGYQSAGPIQRCHRPKSSQNGRQRLFVEILEDRALPSVYLVANLDDSGDGSLRQAVLDANDNPGANTIEFAHGLAGVISLTGGPLTITNDLVIDGPGASLVTVSGSNASRVFETAEGINVAINGLTVADGQADQGGGIYNAGNLTLLHTAVIDNLALGPAGDFGKGGGIYNAGGATLVVSESTFSGNHAIGGDGASGQAGGEGVGGAIENAHATLTVIHSTFTDNRSVGGSAGEGAGAGGADGGAVRNDGEDGPAVFTATDSVFSGNVALGGIGGQVGMGMLDGNAAGAGGVIENLGEALLTLTGCTLTHNKAIGGAAGSGHKAGGGVAGAVHNYGYEGGNAIAFITQTTMIGNEARGGDGDDGGAAAGANGGAIQNASASGGTAFLSVSSTVFSDNQAIGGDGGPSGNGGNASGGAISGAQSAVISSTILSDNQAIGGRGGDGGNGGIGHGGGLQCNGGTVLLDQDTITGNEAIGGIGGSGGQDGAGVGGGLYINAGDVYAHETTIQGNFASTSDDDVFGDVHSY
jgi:hypothetical protein